jgi:outer membrane protein TolC
LKENQQVLAAESLTAGDEQIPDEQQSLVEAFNTRPDLLAAEAQHQAAKYDSKAALEQRLPEFHFAGYLRSSKP